MYVLNNGVTVVTDPSFCPEGNSCGFFNASQLEIPFFANNYNHLPNLRITFEMYGTTSSVVTALEVNTFIIYIYIYILLNISNILNNIYKH